MSQWGDGLPGFGDFPAGAWGDGLPLGPVEAAATIKVSSASMTNCISVLVTYDSEAKHVSSLGANDSLNPNNYTIAGPSTINVDAVELVQASPTTVRLSITAPDPDGVIQGVNNYTVTVSNVESAAGVSLDPASNSATFSGVSCQATGWVAEILIGSEVVWSAENSVPESILEINTEKYTGTHELKFRIRGT